MKKIIILLTGLLIFGCNDNDELKGDPPAAYLFFNLKKSDGSSFEGGEVFYKGGYNNYAGEIVFWENWFSLEKVETNFGLYFEYPEIRLMEWDIYDRYDHYIVLKYMESEITDTVLIRESITQNPKKRNLEFFLNGEKVVPQNPENSYNWTYIMTITKEEF